MAYHCLHPNSNHLAHPYRMEKKSAAHAIKEKRKKSVLNFTIIDFTIIDFTVLGAGEWRYIKL